MKEGIPMTALKTSPAGAVTLRGRTAEELMTPNPVSLREDVPLREAIAFLVDRNISGAPVIDEAGRPVGVLTQSDILVHDREEAEHLALPEAEFGAPLPRSWRDSFQIERVDTTPVRDSMTPAVFCVALDTPAWGVVEQMRELNVHRLFVTDADGVMVGVITAMDVIRALTAGD
jgi:CBS domain-containing protein